MHILIEEKKRVDHFYHFPKKKPKSKIFITFFLNGFQIKGQIMELKFQSNQNVPGSIAPATKTGTAEPVQDGSVVYSSSNEAAFTVEADATDQLKFTVKGVGQGTGQLNISADADLGDGVVTISTSVDITVTEPQATQIGVTFGDPVDQG